MKEIAFHLAVLVFAMGCTHTAQKNEKSPEPIRLQSATLSEVVTHIQENPSSKQFKQALDRYIFLSDSMDYTGIPLTGSLDIRILENDSVELHGSIYQADLVKNQCYDYLTFDGHWKNNRRMSVTARTTLSTDTLYYSKGLFNIALVGDSLPYQDIQYVVFQISEAISEYKDYLGSNWFGKEFNQLNEKQAHLIDSLVGVRIQIFHFQEEYRYINQIES
jgi:hypothetical protein